MKKKPSKPPKKPCAQGWAKALDVDAYDEMLAAAYRYVRGEVLHLTLSEVERRSRVSRQFWRKVERAEMHPSTHTEVPMCNALHVRPSTMHRLAERWLRRGRKLKVWLLWLLPLEVEFLTALAGVEL